MITRTEIITHYKNFFGLENMQLAEDDHLVVDWVESLIEDKMSAMCETNAHSVLYAVPIVAGNSYGIQFLCLACDFPEDETLTMDMKHCWNCGVK